MDWKNTWYFRPDNPAKFIFPNKIMMTLELYETIILKIIKAKYKDKQHISSIPIFLVFRPIIFLKFKFYFKHDSIKEKTNKIKFEIIITRLTTLRIRMTLSLFLSVCDAHEYAFTNIIHITNTHARSGQLRYLYNLVILDNLGTGEFTSSELVNKR